MIVTGRLGKKAGTKAGEEAASIHGRIVQQFPRQSSNKRTADGKAYRRPAAAMISARR
jgi:hypothetical protein